MDEDIKILLMRMRNELNFASSSIQKLIPRNYYGYNSSFLNSASMNLRTFKVLYEELKTKIEIEPKTDQIITTLISSSLSFPRNQQYMWQLYDEILKLWKNFSN